MREKPEINTLEILLNYQKNRNFAGKIAYSEGNGWVLVNDFKDAFLKTKRNKQKWKKELDSRAYLLLNHPWIEKRTKKDSPIKLIQNKDEYKKSAYRLKRDIYTWKKIYRFLYKSNQLKMLTESDYFQDLIKHFEHEQKEFSKLFPSAELAKTMPELFYLFLEDENQAKVKAKELSLAYKAYFKHKIKEKYKSEYEEILRVSKKALELAKQKSLN